MMKKVLCGVLPLVCVLVSANDSLAQATPATPGPRGEATIVSAAAFKKVIDTLGTQRNIDKVVQTVATRGPAGNISIGAVAYHASPRNWDGVANEHSMITEVFHITKGSATFVLGGDLENPKAFDSNAEGVRKVSGPGQGGQVKGYKIVTAVVGDTIVVPPNTPHNIIEVPQDFEMVVVRIDSAKVLHLD